jgi:predicted secreted protein
VGLERGIIFLEILLGSIFEGSAQYLHRSFFAQSGKRAIPAVRSRIKMGETTEVITLVKSEDGYYMANTKVKVTVGGCGG